MKFIITLATAPTFPITNPTDALAGTLIAKVDASEQTMRIYRNGKPLYSWLVSTARKGKRTPRGAWSAWLSRHHKSSLYNDVPMPHSNFFNGNTPFTAPIRSTA